MIPYQKTIEDIQTKLPGDAYVLSVYIALARHARKTGDIYMCFPSLKRVGKVSGLSKPSVVRKIKLLEKWRFIERVDGRKHGYLSKVTKFNLSKYGEKRDS